MVAVISSYSVIVRVKKIQRLRPVRFTGLWVLSRLFFFLSTPVSILLAVPSFCRLSLLSFVISFY